MKPGVHHARTRWKSSFIALRRRRHRVRLPRGFQTWEADGVRLTVLSSLAPQTAGALIHPPPWLRGGQAGKGG